MVLLRSSVRTALWSPRFTAATSGGTPCAVGVAHTPTSRRSATGSLRVRLCMIQNAKCKMQTTARLVRVCILNFEFCISWCRLCVQIERAGADAEAIDFRAELLANGEHRVRQWCASRRRKVAVALEQPGAPAHHQVRHVERGVRVAVAHAAAPEQH